MRGSSRKIKLYCIVLSSLRMSVHSYLTERDYLKAITWHDTSSIIVYTKRWGLPYATSTKRLREYPEYKIWNLVLSNSIDILHELLNLIVESLLGFLLELLKFGIVIGLGSDNSSGDRLSEFILRSRGLREDGNTKVKDCEIHMLRRKWYHRLHQNIIQSIETYR